MKKLLFAAFVAIVASSVGCVSTQSDITRNPADPSRGWLSSNGMVVPVHQENGNWVQDSTLPPAPAPSNGERISTAVATRVVSRTDQSRQIEEATGSHLVTAVQTNGAQLSSMDSAIRFAGQSNDLVGVYEGRMVPTRAVVNGAATGPSETRTPAPGVPAAPGSGD